MKPGDQLELSPEGLQHFASSERVLRGVQRQAHLASVSPDGKYVYLVFAGTKTVRRYAAPLWKVKQAVPRRPEVTVSMSPPALRVFAKKWMLAGFAASGRGMNGDTMPPDRYPALKSILGSYFDKLYDEDREVPVDSCNRRTG